MLNKVLIQGRLTREVEYYPDKNYARYTLACDRYNGEADFIDCTCFNKCAEFASKYLKKGQLILVEGSIRTGKYEKDGKNIKTTSVVVNEHHFCDSKKNDSNGQDFAGIDADIEEDLPFK